MRRGLPTLGAFLILVAACGGGTASDTTTTATQASTTTTTAPTTTTTDPGFSVSSDDGRVTIQVTPDALADDPGIAITALPAEEHPEALADLDIEPWVYSLEPGELQFDAPVRLTMAIPLQELSAEGFETDLPLVTLVTTTADGGWEFLDDLTITFDATNLIVSGLTDHFSRLAAVQEQIYVRTRFIEITQGRTESLGFTFLWSNGVPLTPPALSFSAFRSTDGQGVTETGLSFIDGVVTVTCPPKITTTIGDLDLTFLLESVSDSSGETGIVSAPKITTLQDEQTMVTFSAGLQLLCTPTITEDGTITIDLQVDHPDGEQIVPAGDFKNGLSALYLYLGPGLLPMYVGLIRDVDADGQVGPNDILYPPEATDITDGISTATLPLFGYGDYFLYFIADKPSALETEVRVKDGATILLGGLMAEETAVPYLNGVPFLARVFSEESRQTENTELVILLTPRLVENSEE